MMRRLVLAACLLPLAQGTAAGQATDSLSRASVDVWPVGDPGNAAPRYPELLREARVDGMVHLRLTIDSTGLIVARSLQVVSSTHDIFTDAARRAIVEWKFRPARRDGRPVSVRHDVVVDFVLPEPDSIPLRPARTTIRSNSTTRMALGWEPEPRTRISLDDAGLRAAQLAAVRTVMPRARPDSARVACVSLRLGASAVDPSPIELAPFASNAHEVVVGSRCPPTYPGATRHADSAARPHDEIPSSVPDPWRVWVRRVRPWNDDVVLVDVGTGQGWSGHLYACEVRRSEGLWRAHCHVSGSWVS